MLEFAKLFQSATPCATLGLSRTCSAVETYHSIYAVTANENTQTIALMLTDLADLAS